MEATGKRAGKPVSFEAVRKTFDDLDVDSDGLISYDEWMAAQLRIKRRRLAREAKRETRRQNQRQSSGASTGALGLNRGASDRAADRKSVV